MAVHPRAVSLTAKPTAKPTAKLTVRPMVSQTARPTVIPMEATRVWTTRVTALTTQSQAVTRTAMCPERPVSVGDRQTLQVLEFPARNPTSRRQRVRRTTEDPMGSRGPTVPKAVPRTDPNPLRRVNQSTLLQAQNKTQDRHHRMQTSRTKKRSQTRSNSRRRFRRRERRTPTPRHHPATASKVPQTRRLPTTILRTRTKAAARAEARAAISIQDRPPKENRTSRKVMEPTLLRALLVEGGGHSAGETPDINSAQVSAIQGGGGEASQVQQTDIQVTNSSTDAAGGADTTVNAAPELVPEPAPELVPEPVPEPVQEAVPEPEPVYGEPMYEEPVYEEPVAGYEGTDYGAAVDPAAMVEDITADVNAQITDAYTDEAYVAPVADPVTAPVPEPAPYTADYYSEGYVEPAGAYEYPATENPATEYAEPYVEPVAEPYVEPYEEPYVDDAYVAEVPVAAPVENDAYVQETYSQVEDTYEQAYDGAYTEDVYQAPVVSEVPAEVPVQEEVVVSEVASEVAAESVEDITADVLE